MTAQIVMTQAVISPGSSTNNGSISKELTTSNFSDCLTNNLKSDARTNSAKVTKDFDDTMAKNKNKANNNNSAKVSEQVKQNQEVSKSMDVKEPNKPKVTDSTKDISMSKTDNVIKENLSALEAKIKEIIKDSLEMNEEELNQMMKMLNLSMFDLLNTDNLKNLVLASQGESNITAVLTNEDLASKLTGLLQKMSELNLDDFGISEDDLQNLLAGKSEEIINSNKSNQITKADDVKSSSNFEKVLTTQGNLVDNELNAKNLFGKDSKTIDQDVIEEKNISIIVEDSTSKSSRSENENDGSLMNRKDENNQQDNKGSNIHLDSNKGSPVNQFVNNLTFAATRLDGTTQQIVEASQMREIVDQVVQKIRIHVDTDTTSMDIQLDPEHLGKVNLSVIAKDGVLTAQFAVQNSAAKEAIESQLQLLKDNLNNQGVKVEAIEVTVSNFSFAESNGAGQGNKEQKSSPRKLNLNELDEFSDLSTENEMIADMMQVNGNTVDYTA